MSNMELNEMELNRREALGKLRELGIEPYPAALYPVNATAQQIKDEYDPEKGNLADVVIAGRIMSRRIMGAAAFIELQDETGRIQVYVKRDEICPGEDKTMYNTVFKKLLDIGDIIGIKGYAFITQRIPCGEQVAEILSNTSRETTSFCSLPSSLSSFSLTAASSFLSGQEKDSEI